MCRAELRLTAHKMGIKDFPKLLSATSFIRKTLYEIPNPSFGKGKYLKIENNRR